MDLDIIIIIIIIYLVSQCSAFSLNKKGNFEELLEKNQDVSTFHSRCANHQLNQAITDCIGKFTWIQQFEKIMLNHILKINKSEEYRKLMGGRGPTNFLTRRY
jgi:amino acid permease